MIRAGISRVRNRLLDPLRGRSRSAQGVLCELLVFATELPKQIALIGDFDAREKSFQR
jgi:hypothetical protein